MGDSGGGIFDIGGPWGRTEDLEPEEQLGGGGMHVGTGIWG